MKEIGRGDKTGERFTFNIRLIFFNSIDKQVNRDAKVLVKIEFKLLFGYRG
jgi:hypothetical protein